MIRRKKPLQRGGRPKPKRKSAEEREWVARVREEVWVRDGKQCVDCGKPLPLDGDEFTRMHAAHTVRRWRLGADYRKVWDPAVLLSKCYDCHIGKEHNAGGKPCPPKPKGQDAIHRD